MGFVAVIVNCGLIGLSGPVHRIFPNITGAQTVILIIILEHLMLLVKLIISAAIPDVPHSVAVELARAEHRSDLLVLVSFPVQEEAAGEGGEASGEAVQQGDLESRE